MIELSDVVTFHNYDSPSELEGRDQLAASATTAR